MDQSKLNFLQNVLRYSTTHSDGTSPTELREMSPERRQWLESALTNMTINPIDEIKKCIKSITDDQDLDRQIEALETLKDWCEDINFAIGKFVYFIFTYIITYYFYRVNLLVHVHKTIHIVKKL